MEEFSGKVQRNMMESVGHYNSSNNQPRDIEIFFEADVQTFDIRITALCKHNQNR